MSGSPIFDQLQAEFVEQSKYVRLCIGPLIGEGFERVEVVHPYFGTTGYVHRLIEVEVSEPVEPMIEEVVDDATIDASSVLEINLAKSREKAPSVETNPVQAFPKLYIVEGAPELVNLAEAKDEEPMVEETEMEKTISIPKFEHEKPVPPSIASDETQLIPVVPDVDEESAQTPEKPADDKDRVVPIRKPKAIHKTVHRKLSATGTLGWFINRAA